MQTVSFAGSNYNIPNVRGDTPWSGLSDFVIAAASKAINTGGGSFTLLADINFGATFGLVSTYYKSRTASVADAGQLRLANTDTIKWRNGLGSANLSLSISSNNLTFEGTKVILSGAIVNADIAALAAIAVNKLAALTVSRAVVSDASGFLAAATTTAVEIGYVNGVTSAIQTQINTKAADSAVVHNTGVESIAGVKTFSAQDVHSAGISVTGETSGLFLNATASYAGLAELRLNNTSVNAAAQAVVEILVAAGAVGDAYMLYSLNGGGATSFTTGMDNSDGDSFVISRGLAIGTTNALRADGTTGAVAIRGTTTNDSAAAGFVGEYVESVVGSVAAAATTVYKDATSISLTAGDWDVSAICSFSPGTVTTFASMGISQTSGNSGTGLVTGSNRAYITGNAVTTGQHTLSIPPYRQSLSGTTTIYLKEYFEYSGTAPAFDGARLSARRVR